MGRFFWPWPGWSLDATRHRLPVIQVWSTLNQIELMAGFTPCRLREGPQVAGRTDPRKDGSFMLDILSNPVSEAASKPPRGVISRTHQNGTGAFQRKIRLAVESKI